MADPQQEPEEQELRPTNHHYGNYVEYDPFSAPQVVIHEAPEVVNAYGAGGDAANDVRAFEAGIEPPVVAGNKGKIRSERSWKTWCLNWKLIACLIATIIILIVVPVVLTGKLQGDKSGTDGDSVPTPSITPSMTTSTSGSLTSSISSAIPTSSSQPFPGCNPSEFRDRVNWIGIADNTGWNFTILPAEDAEECCIQCYTTIDKGCNGWLYMPQNATGMPPCTIVYGFSSPDADASDDLCPNGKPDIVFAKGGEDSKDNFGGGGPCARYIRGVGISKRPFYRERG